MPAYSGVQNSSASAVAIRSLSSAAGPGGCSSSSGLKAGSAASPSYSSAVIPSGASACTVRSAAVLPDPRLVLPEMSRIRTSAAIRTTYLARAALPAITWLSGHRP